MVNYSNRRCAAAHQSDWQQNNLRLPFLVIRTGTGAPATASGWHICWSLSAIFSASYSDVSTNRNSPPPSSALIYFYDRPTGYRLHEPVVHRSVGPKQQIIFRALFRFHIFGPSDVCFFRNNNFRLPGYCRHRADGYLLFAVLQVVASTFFSPRQIFCMKRILRTTTTSVLTSSVWKWQHKESASVNKWMHLSPYLGLR